MLTHVPYRGSSSACRKSQYNRHFNGLPNHPRRSVPKVSRTERPLRRARWPSSGLTAALTPARSRLAPFSRDAAVAWPAWNEPAPIPLRPDAPLSGKPRGVRLLRRSRASPTSKRYRARGLWVIRVTGLRPAPATTFSAGRSRRAHANRQRGTSSYRHRCQRQKLRRVTLAERKRAL